MHIAVSCSHDFSPAFGVSRVLRGIEAGLLLTRKAAKVTFYGMSAQVHRELVGAAVHAGLDLKLGPKALSWGSYRVLWEQTALPRLCVLDDVDLLHMPAYTAPLLSRIPVVVTVHDILSATHPELCRRRNVLHHRLVVPRTLRQAKRIFTVSDHVRSEVNRHFGLPLDRMTTIHPGIGSEFLEPIQPEALRRVKQRYGLPSRYLLWVGHQEPKKNLPRLLEALHLLQASGSGIPLVMTGPALTQRETAVDTRGIGWVAAEDLPALYAGAASLVFPSLAEGWGLPVAEALALGTPVVASAIPAVMEIAPDAVVQVDATSADNIAGGIRTMLNDTALRRRLAFRGRAAALHFTWERHADQLWAAYRETLREEATTDF